MGNVCSVFKRDDPSLQSNYRPITLLNSEDKVFERLVFKYLYNHLHDNNILTPLQSGFIPGDSTVNHLTLSVMLLILEKRFVSSFVTFLKPLTASGKQV